MPNSNMEYFKLKRLLNVKTDTNGLINLGNNSDLPWIISVGISSSYSDFTIDKVWCNQYGLWYARIVGSDGNLRTDTTISVIVLYSMA